MDSNKSQQQNQNLTQINNYFFKNNFLNQNNSQKQNFQGGMNIMRLTEINIMNMNQINMNNLRMTYMNQLNNPLLLNLTMMPNSSMNLTHFKNNDDKEEKYIGQIEMDSDTVKEIYII